MRVKRRDGYRCLQCGKNKSAATLQVHHENYLKGKPPWEYALSDCRTLCKACHAKEHNLLEPDRGWFLIAIDDFGSPDGICERQGCGSEIRYAHLTYHPNWGYKTVGSTCIEHLTQKDRLLSGKLVSLYKNISKFVHTSNWEDGFTNKGKKYIYCKYRHHLIRIYGDSNDYAFQLVLKEKGVRWHDYRKIMRAKGKSLPEAKELAYIVLKGTIATDNKEKNRLRDIYQKIK